ARLVRRPPPRSPLFPYTTLFRSLRPTFGGSASLADLTLRDFRAPFVQGVINYEDRILDANLLLWKTGTRVLTVRAALPLDLAFRSEEHTSELQSRENLVCRLLLE